MSHRGPSGRRCGAGWDLACLQTGSGGVPGWGEGIPRVVQGCTGGGYRDLQNWRFCSFRPVSSLLAKSRMFWLRVGVRNPETAPFPTRLRTKRGLFQVWSSSSGWEIPPSGTSLSGPFLGGMILDDRALLACFFDDPGAETCVFWPNTNPCFGPFRAPFLHFLTPILDTFLTGFARLGGQGPGVENNLLRRVQKVAKSGQNGSKTVLVDEDH